MTTRERRSEAEQEQIPVWDEVKALARVDGDRSLLTELATLFVDQATADLEVLRLAWAERNMEALAKTAHRLKGAVLQFEASGAYAACCRLEEVARNGLEADAEVVWHEVEAEVSRLTAVLRTIAA